MTEQSKPDDGPGELSRKDSFREAMRFFGWLAPYRGRLALAASCSFISIGFGLMFPFLVGHLLDAAVPSIKEIGPGRWNPSLNQVALLIVSALGLQSVFSFLASISFNRVGERAVVDLRQTVFGRLIRLPMAFFAEKRVGDLTSRMTSDLSIIQETFTGTIPQAIRQVLLLLGGVVFIALTSVRLSLVMVSSFPVLLLLALFFGRRIRKISRAAQDRLGETTTVVEESLQGIANIKAFGNEAFEGKRYAKGLAGFLELILRAAVFRAGLVAFIIFGIFGSITLVLWYGATLMRQGELTHGELTRFILYTTFVGGAVVSFADVFGQINKMGGAASRVRELTDEIPELPEGETHAAHSAEEGQRIQGAAEFDAVRFRYPSRPDVEVLKGLTLRADAGERIALVGASGAGKSTVVSLLLRYYEPDSGRLLIDGKPSSSYDLSAVRSAMAVVPQEVMLFGGTIRENIAYGDPTASDEAIQEAARRANCHDFIIAFPEGYETVVGERGIKLSGGQRQRVAIARALLKNPAILILDEATSSLDSESERLVQEAVEELLVGRTAIIIAHRLATVRRVDRIYVMDEGAVVESGTHDELMRMPDGVYRKLSEMQYFEAPETV